MDFHTMDTDLDEGSEKQDSVEVTLVDMEAADGDKKSLTSKEEKGMVENQKKTTELVSLYMIKQPFVKLNRIHLSTTQISKAFTSGPQKRGRGRPKRDPQNKTSYSKKQEKNVMIPFDRYVFNNNNV